MLLIKNAQIYTMAGDEPFKGDILVNDHKIIKLGSDILCEDAEIIDAEGLCALPGIIDCHTHIGLMNLQNPIMGGDATETTSAVTPSMNVIYGVDVTVKDFEQARKNGITTVGILPGSANVVNGIAFAAKTYGTNIFDMCIKNPVGLKIAFGENPKGMHGGKNRAPASRMGVIPLFRELLYNGREYARKKEEAEKNGAEFEINDDLEAVVPVIRKEIPLRIHCTHNDMATAVDIAKEFDVKFTIEHAWGADDYMEEIVESGCGIVYGPIGGKRTFFESRRTDIGSVAKLDKRGVIVALTTDSPILNLRSLINMAEEAVRQGAAPQRAIAMITVNPAKILGVSDKTGTIEVGKDADIALFRGLPTRDMAADIACTVAGGSVIYPD